MRATPHLLLVSLSSLTLMCSAPNEPAAPGPMTTAGSGNQSGSPAGGSGGAGVLPSGGNQAMAGGGAGTAGAASLAGSGGELPGGGSAGAGGSTGFPMGKTAGCQAPDPVEEPQTWITHQMTVTNLPPTLTPEQMTTFSDRRYFVRLPVGYDHTKAYPLVFYGPGCGAANVEGTPMMDQIKNDAIHVFLLQKNNCFSTGYPSPEVPYFTQALDAIQGKYCTDSSRVFVSGYSSGAWLSNMLACAMGNRIRAIGTAAGGLRKTTIDNYTCPSPQAGILYVGENDTENPASELDDNGFEQGVIGARDRLIQSNGCDANAAETWASNDICQIWKTGCENNPVIYCVGPGDGHGRGDGQFNVSNQGFWELWNSLPQ